MHSALASLRQYVEQREPLDREGTALRISRFIEGNRENCQWFWEEARESHCYAGGQQWPRDLWEKRKNEQRPALVVDKTSTAIDSFTGRIQTERFQATIAPENYEEPLAGPLDQFSKEQRRRAGGETVLADAFRDMWVGRIGIERIVPFQDGPVLGERRDVIPVWEMMWDTKSRKQNFRDRRGHVHGRYVNAWEFRSIAGDEAEDFFKIWDSSAEGQAEVSSWPLNIEDVYLREQETVFMYTHEWRDRERCCHVRLPEPLDQLALQEIGDSPHTDEAVLEALGTALVLAGESLAAAERQPLAKLGWTLTTADFEKLEETYLVLAGVPLPPRFYQKLSRERYYRAHMVGNRLVGKVEPIPEQRFTYIFLTDNMVKDPQLGHRPRSYIRSIQDQQDAMNRALSGMMDGAGRSVKNVLFYKTGFLKHAAQARDQLSVDGGMIETNLPPTADNFTLVQTKPNPVYRDIYEMLEKIFSQEIISAYEQGGVQDLRRTSFKALSSVTQNARGKQGSRFAAYSMALADEVELQVHQAWAYYSYEEMLDIIGPGYMTTDPETGEQAPVLPPDRRLWLHALRRQVAITESPYTAVERDELFAKLNESGFWQMLFGALPPQLSLPILMEFMPAALSAHSPKGVQKINAALAALSQPQQPPASEESEETPPN